MTSLISFLQLMFSKEGTSEKVIRHFVDKLLKRPVLIHAQDTCSDQSVAHIKTNITF